MAYGAGVVEFVLVLIDSYGNLASILGVFSPRRIMIQEAARYHSAPLVLDSKTRYLCREIC